MPREQNIIRGMVIFRVFICLILVLALFYTIAEVSFNS